MDKKITCYLDCVSPYSYHAFSYLQKNAAALADLGVEIEYVVIPKPSNTGFLTK